jgi:serine/threonine protein kinase
MSCKSLYSLRYDANSIRLCGYAPFFGKTEKLLYDRIKTGAFDFAEEPWPNISLEVKDFISKLLTVDSAKRMSAQEALEHPWIVSNRSHNSTGLIRL